MIAHRRTAHGLFPRARVLLLSSWFLLTALPPGSQAQVPTALTPDTTLGTSVSRSGPVYTITGGRQHGPNLFHSFARFSVGTHDTATFTGPAGISNVLSRVTGGQRSAIDGTVRSELPGAHLYLLNPSGVVFGPNARLEVSGAVHVSTADVIRLADGGVFAADPAVPSLLTVAAPVAFGFLRETPAAIRIEGSMLHVAAGQTLSVVGGDIDIVGNAALTSQGLATLGAPSGTIHLTSVAAPGEVASTPAAPPAALQGDPGRLGAITISNMARLDASGESGGMVAIRGERLLVDGGQIVVHTGQASGASPGIDIQVREAALFTNDAVLTTEVRGAGNAGAIQVTAKRVEVSQGARLSSLARMGTSESPTSGSVGNVTIAAGSVLVTGTVSDRASLIESRTQGETSGDAGQVTITADTLTVERGAEVRSGTRSAGSAGTVAIQVNQLTLRDGGRIEANVSSGASGGGSPGSITVRATDHVTIDGANNTATGLVSQTNVGSRSAGTVNVQTGRLEITGGGQISTNAARSSDRDGPPGNAGTVQIMAHEVILAGPGSRLTSTTPGRGNAGQVDLEVGRLTITDGAQIDTGTAPGSRGRAGTITIRATDAVTLASTDVAEARLVSRAAGSGNGGQITIATPRLAVASGGRISAIALRDGQDGRIDVTAVGSLMLAGGLVDRFNEIHLDGSLGPSGLLEGADITIEAALGQIHGANLFHSFSRFRLLPGGTVTFTGPSQVTTILSRVTGAEPALIEGTLRSDIPGASLFFLAPRGCSLGRGRGWR